ncbi:hypothetical protein HS041_28700 [Planomonospora sp. ID67723]|nr:hypothetical protein [Planomonospora sp. ID67723]
MAPAVRKLALTVHVTSSAGWLGAVVCFLALAVTGLSGQDAPRGRGLYPAMEVITWAAIVPLAFATLLSGVVSSLGTPWGLFRHYWVLAKLALTVFAIGVLVMQLGVIGAVADAAAMTGPSGADLRELRISLVLHSGGGLLVLLSAMVLAVYKPRGTTRYGRRAHSERPTGRRPRLIQR